MSPGLVKGVLVTGIVFGFQSLLWGIYFSFRADGRVKAIQSFLRGGLTILFFSVAYYFFTLGFFEGLSDVLTIVIFCGFSAFSLLLEIALQGGPKFRSPEPMTAELWQQRKVTKWQMMLMMTLVPVYVLLTAAVVFRIVAPEVLELHWWVLIILASSLAYLLFGLRQWSANQRKFGSQTEPPK